MNDVQLLTKIVKQLEEAWNAADAQAFAAPFADDADFVHILGAHYNGREAIQHGHQQIWDTIYKGSRTVYEIEGMRMIRPDVAIVFVLGTVTMESGGDSKVIQARPTMILEKSGDRWQIVTFQNTLVGPPRPFEDSRTGYPNRPK
ncbi:MAG: SgcJ/EcaC family oxidoreductase [Candidatus Zixiibacteriota bacterium]